MLLGEILITISGFFLGYVFPDLLHRYGADEELSYSYISPMTIAVIPVAAYISRPLWIKGSFAFTGIKGFTSSVFIWMALTLLIGGFIRILQHYISE